VLARPWRNIGDGSAGVEFYGSDAIDRAPLMVQMRNRSGRVRYGPLQLADVPRLLQAQVIDRGFSVWPVQRTPRVAGLSGF
jgi:hypothetical protein